MTLHASLPDGPAAGHVAIVLEPAARPQSAEVRLETHGVSHRERQVASLLAQGLSYAEIATALVLSPYTVEDHVRSLFEKTGVTSRQQLVGRIFLDDYLPDVVRGTSLRSDGGFDAG
jgi:DNA-binding NarL/FixJ family response regulator